MKSAFFLSLFLLFLSSSLAIDLVNSKNIILAIIGITASFIFIYYTMNYIVGKGVGTVSEKEPKYFGKKKKGEPEKVPETRLEGLDTLVKEIEKLTEQQKKFEAKIDELEQ